MTGPSRRPIFHLSAGIDDQENCRVEPAEQHNNPDKPQGVIDPVRAVLASCSFSAVSSHTDHSERAEEPSAEHGRKVMVVPAASKEIAAE
jgi:hypothetical protein